MNLLMKLMMFLVGHLSELDVIEYALEGLDKEARRKAEDHLLKCKPCRDAVRAAMELHSGLASLAPQVQPPQELQDRILKRVLKDAGLSGSRRGGMP